MNLSALIRAHLPTLQSEAEGTMLDHFDVYAPGPGTDADGFETTSATVPKDSTVGKVAGRGGLGGSDPESRIVEIGGVQRYVMAGGLHIPLGAQVPSVGWEYVLVELGPDSDPALLNRRYRVVDVPAKSYATARRLDVVEVP